MELRTEEINEIFEIYEKIKQISKNNTIIEEELDQLITKKVQTSLNLPDFSYWVIFGNGKFDYGEGEIQDIDILVKCNTHLMLQILNQKRSYLTEFVKKGLQIQGDIQYGVVYFDFLNYSLDMSKNKGGELS